MQLLSILKLAFIALAMTSNAHPGEDHDHVIERRQAAYRKSVRRQVQGCADYLERRGVAERGIARRNAFVQEMYTKNRKRENPDTVNNTNHHSDANYTISTPESVIFSSLKACGLNPEGETGPYFIPGETIRNDIRENQPGVPLWLELQVIDVATCEPIKDVYVDIWNVNSTGVYSGIVESGNGNGNDTTNALATFLRGVSPTDEEGVVRYYTLVPGHYSGRANHIHIIAHVNATVLQNGTITGGSDAHVGQLFWDEDLLDIVEASYPYNTNTIPRTNNVDDGVFITETENTTTDPVIEYVYLGDELSDGLLGWITIGINVSATQDPNYSFRWTDTGSVPDVHGTNTGSPGWSQIGDWD